MDTLRRYLARDIYGATLFVFVAFLGLFAFFDLINELGELGRGTSVLTPEILSVLFVLPERMSAWNLYQYSRHLSDNRQKTERYEIAMWKKLVYPFASLVMMALALPFAYVHTRAGGVGVKVFSGIMLGILFHMLNSLFSHLGLLQNWQPLLSAALPSAVFLAAAGLMMWWVERR